MPGDRVVESLTVSSRLTRSLLRFAVARGQSETTLLAASGIDPRVLADVEGRVPVGNHGRLWAAAVSASDDPDFGLHVGDQTPPTAVSLVGYAVLSAPTLGDAFEALVQYFTLFSEGIHLDLDRGGAGGPARLELRPVGVSHLSTAPRHPTESIMATLWSVSTAVTGHPLPGAHVAFAHARPSTGTAAHEAIFGVVPAFGAPVACLSFEAAALGWPGVEASPRLHASLRHEADEVIARLHPSIPQSVAHAVARRFQGRVPTLAEVAADLAIGERSLQRHLEEEGVTFLRVVNDVRREMALHYLDDGTATLHEIAFSLGYSEPSAFHRAFKRWTGETPGEHRIRKRTGGKMSA